MVFNSLLFIVFFVLIMAVHYASILSWRTKKVNLLAASYLFYAVWNPPFIILLWISTVVDYLMARQLSREERQYRRKFFLLVSLILNLGMLAYFKYAAFLLDNFVMLLSTAGIHYNPPAPDIILPVGISFYTFQTLSYTIDVYRRKISAESSFLDFALFVTFFPQLVAGPIVRPDALIPQFKTPHYANRQQMSRGLGLILLGLFMKVVVADNFMAPSADLVFGFPAPLLALDAWTGVLAFSGQIFCDFAGYSTCAIGAACCLGFAIKENFRYPYAALGFSDFWKRWHISFSSWLRDYLYIPLGGNRKGEGRTYFNLMLTMLLGGLWHGASWTFVVWGGLHGVYLIAERLIRKIRDAKESPVTTEAETVLLQSNVIPGITPGRISLFWLAALTFFLVNITWVFFRAHDFKSAWRLLMAMFGGIDNGMPIVPTLDIIKVFVVTIIILIIHWIMRERDLVKIAEDAPVWISSLVLAIMFMMLLLAQQTGDAFIYFQF